MKLFISWSGKRSQMLASSLRDGLPLVLHYVEPWVSEGDISAGGRWALAAGRGIEYGADHLGHRNLRNTRG